MRTPHIDGIAERGVAFDRFYVASPVCMPNRASLMTGRMPSVHRVRANGIPLPIETVTFVDLLRDAGYATALVGKRHLQNFTVLQPLKKAGSSGPGVHQPSEPLRQAIRPDLGGPAYSQEDPEFWARQDAHVQTPFYGFAHVDLVTGHGDTVGGDYLRWLHEHEPNADRLRGPKNGLSHDYVCPQAHRTALPEHLYSTAYIAERACAYITALQNRPERFFLMVSFPDPHHPFNPPGRYWDMYRPEQFPVPEAFHRNDWTPPPHVAGVLAERESGAANLQGMNSIGVTPREAQEAIALTCGMITCIDDAVGQITRAVEQAGLLDNTVLAFTTDHGEHLGDHRLLLKGAEQYQSIIRVPFIWADPDVARSARAPEIASTIDISATILARAEIAPYAGMQGRSLLPVIANPRAKVRHAAFVQYEHQKSIPGLGMPPRVHSLVTKEWRISVFDGVDWGELYNLEHDPGEFDNLWNDPAYRTERAELTEQLLRVEIEHVDRVPLPTKLA